MSDTEPTLDAGAERLAQMQLIKEIIRDFHMALDLRENGGTAGWKALLDIQKILDMPWVQGAEQTRRRTGK